MLNKKALAGTPSTPPVYVEDVFSTYLVTGTGSGSQTITNNIDLAGEGGMVWWKTRNFSYNHYLFDTTRGATNWLVSNETGAQSTVSSTLTSFNADGFTIGDHSRFNGNTYTDVSWTFRKAPKFFDVVTWTGNGAASRSISHSLASQPGMIMFKKTSATSAWDVLARNGSQYYSYLQLNTTGAALASTISQSGAASSTTFKIDDWNDNGATYVAYLFAHNAGGFGTAGTDNIISCGSFTTNGSAEATVDLGYEPQFLLVKRTDSASSWLMFDTMRGMPNEQGLTSNEAPSLSPDTSGAQSFWQQRVTATGFFVGPSAYGVGVANGTYIYMAIRRPMKTPTSGTEVFGVGSQVSSSGNTGGWSAGFTTDAVIKIEQGGISNHDIGSRLMGNGRTLYTDATNAEANDNLSKWDYQFGWGLSSSTYSSDKRLLFKRASGFMDIVCYTGDGAQRNLTHNLGKAPGMVIVRGRSSNTAGEDWAVWHQNGSQANGFLGARLNTTQAYGNYGQSLWQNDTTAPSMTSTTISLGTNDIVNASAKTYVAYLFGEVSGVSKIGSYTGTGTTQTINCGFTAGARFVLIKRIDSTGDWYIWDTTRGIVSGNDPYLLLNSSAAEVTNTDYIDPANSGFEISSTAPAAINANGGSFIFMAIA